MVLDYLLKENIMSKMNELSIMYDRLTKLDLGYEFSDCGRTYRIGQASVAAFTKDATELYSEEERKFLFDEYSKNTESEYLVRKARYALGL
jgi:hypothetical protein